MDVIDDYCDGLKAEDVEIHNNMTGSLSELEANLRHKIESLLVEIAKVQDLFQRELNNIILRVDEMGGDLALCKQVVAMGMTTTTTEAKKVEVPKPKTFNGTRNA